jgi:hypothetical protein
LRRSASRNTHRSRLITLRESACLRRLTLSRLPRRL